MKDGDSVREKEGREQRMVRRGRNRVEEKQNIWKIKNRERKGREHREEKMGMAEEETQGKGQRAERQ